MSEDRSTRSSAVFRIAVGLAGFVVVFGLRTASPARPAMAAPTGNTEPGASARVALQTLATPALPADESGVQALRAESRRQSLTAAMDMARQDSGQAVAAKSASRETGADVPAFQLRPAGGQAVAASAAPAVTVASWYGPGFNGHRTANGEIYDQEALTAAHPTLPFGSRVRVTNLNNGKQVIVRINDRGPFVSGRGIDLSHAAAQALGMESAGIAPVALEVLAG